MTTEQRWRCTKCGAENDARSGICSRCWTVNKADKQSSESQAKKPAGETYPGLRFQYRSVVLSFDKKAIALSRANVLQGLKPESATELDRLGLEGWELVSVVPYQDGSVGMFSNSKPSTDAALAFMKRAIAG